MSNFYDELKMKAFSAFRTLSKSCPQFQDANMLVGSSDVKVSLTRSKLSKSIDTEWIEKIEAAIPALDIIIRNPSVAIEDVDEVLPVELSKHITEKSIKHLAQHTNYILDIKENGEVVPQKILNVFHEETHLTYENKFINTLLSRLYAFVDKRVRALDGTSGIEMDYKFGYSTEFEHFVSEENGKNSARIDLRIELTSPVSSEMSETDMEINERYAETLERIKRINMALIAYRSSAFSQKLGRNYIRPPVIRTNAILKNKNLRECLNLWEYIEEYDKVGYSVVGDKAYELPSEDFVGGMYSSVALQYLTLYSGVNEDKADAKIISQKRVSETYPEFDEEIETEEIDDYQVYDSEYKKTVPVSRLMNNRKKLSEDEKKIRKALLVALKADELMNADILAAEAEARRIAREKRRAKEEEKRLREEEARRLAEEAKKSEERVVTVRYRRSYMARYIQADESLQNYYTEIKNALLSYKGVKSRIAWSKETFKLGRKYVAKLDVKGKKMLNLYLALDPKLLEGTKYRFSKAEGEFPVRIKVTSERKKKYALELIAMLAENMGIARIEREAEDYRLPYEDDEALIERGLIKVVSLTGEALDENAVTVKAGVNIEVKPKDTESETESESETELSSESEETAFEVIPETGVREIAVRYRRSYTARYIQADESLQNYYTEIKNALLSYKGVKSRIAWSKETFKLGRKYVAKLDVKGKKMLNLYLALDPKLLEGTKYRFSKAEGEFPVRIKVTSERKKKYALELIAMLAENMGIARIEREAEDYRLPYEDDEALIERGLIKVVSLTGEALDENAVTVKAGVNIEVKPKDTESETESESETELSSESEETAFEVISETGVREIAVRYRRSYMARYIQADETLQNYYTEIKNALLSYKGVKSRTAWSKETFKLGRKYVAKLDVKGKKMLNLYLALDPKLLEGTKYRFKKVYGEFPVRIKVTSERKKKYALELIAMLAENMGIARIEREAEDYRLPYEDDEALIERGLIKVVSLTGEALDENAVTVKAGVNITGKLKPGKKN